MPTVTGYRSLSVVGVRWASRKPLPPDAFSATGQDWGLPGYRWDVMEAGGYEWLRARARRSALLRWSPHEQGERYLISASEDGTVSFVPSEPTSVTTAGRPFPSAVARTQ